MLVIINGVPSAGKTSAAKEFIRIFDEKLFLYESYDNALLMLPPRHFSINPNDGFYIKNYEKGGHQIVKGELGERFLWQSINAVGGWLKDGWNVVFDVVEQDREKLLFMKKNFAAFAPVVSFYFYAKPEVIKKRQQGRDDRPADSTLFFTEEMKGVEDLHDFKLDVSEMSPSNIANFMRNRVLGG